MNVKLKWVVAGAAALFSVAAYSQAIQGTITGVVTDKSGAVVVGAEISVKNTGYRLHVYRDFYRHGELHGGSTAYRNVRSEGRGQRVSSSLTERGWRWNPLTSYALTFRWKWVRLPKTVTVTTEAPMLKTENSATVANITVQSLENLPIMSVNGGGTSAATAGLRDPYALLMTTPGTNYVASTSMSANGNSGMNILIEGMTGNMVNPAGTVTDQTQPSAEAVQEVAVLTSNYSPEYGNISGAIMNVTMRSGTNQLSWQRLRVRRE